MFEEVDSGEEVVEERELRSSLKAEAIYARLALVENLDARANAV